MRGKAKSRIALVLAAALALGAVGALSSMAWLTERASNLDPDPSGVEAIGAEDEAAGENDGSGGVDWGYWQGVNPDIIGWVTVPGAGIDYPIVQAHEGDAGLRVLAVDVVDAGREGAKVEFADDAEHAQWLARVVADADLSLVGEGFDFSSVKSVVTLCTCSYNRWGNERTLVICAVDALG